MTESYYAEYARAVTASYERRSETERELLYSAVKGHDIKRVLDLGCGVGQELIPFLQNTQAECFGIDIGPELGQIAPDFLRNQGFDAGYHFTRAAGEKIPFADASFDVILCRVALPYMDDGLALAEMARVLAPGGVLLLKTHAPGFFFAMIRQRLSSLDPKQLAYPLICLTAGAIKTLTGRRPSSAFWQGKEVFQTHNFVRSECRKLGLKIEKELADTNPQTPSYKIIRS